VIKINVDGKPAPQGSKTRNAAGAIYESNKAVGPWRADVRAECQRVMRAAERAPITGAVEVTMRFRLTRPRSHYGTGRNALTVKASAPAYPTSKPDGDKLQRAVLDALTQGGAYRDDSQVIHYDVWLTYADRPGADIVVRELT
jgi:Holliday junction resolvase RusA-like endonuclease